MKKLQKLLGLLLAAVMLVSLAPMALASTFIDAHGNEVEIDDTQEAYTEVTLAGADDAARKYETNLGDLWTDALRWFAVSGKISDAFDEDDIAAGNDSLAVDADHVVALWNGGNLRADIPAGVFTQMTLAEVLPYPNKVAVVYMTGAQLREALEAASQGLPYSEDSAAACAAFMQVSGLSYTVDISKDYDKGEAYGKNWFRAASLGRVEITEVNGQAFDEAATYAVITSNANFNGMDSSYVFSEAAKQSEQSTITTAVVRDVVWMYIDEELENHVTELYAQPKGRITVTEAAPAAETPAGQTYTVGEGDTLWGIAEKFYGTGREFGTLAQINGIPKPYYVYVGQTLVIPAGTFRYTVTEGDTLWGIAAKFYGNGREFGKLAEANGIPKPYYVYVGQTLVIPD